MNRVLSQPRAEAAAATQIDRLARAGFEDGDVIPRFWQWSIEHPAEFWQYVWDVGEVRASRKADAVWRTVRRCPAPGGSRAPG